MIMGLSRAARSAAAKKAARTRKRNARLEIEKKLYKTMVIFHLGMLVELQTWIIYFNIVMILMRIYLSGMYRM